MYLVVRVSTGLPRVHPQVNTGYLLPKHEQKIVKVTKKSGTEKRRGVKIKYPRHPPITSSAAARSAGAGCDAALLLPQRAAAGSVPSLGHPGVFPPASGCWAPFATPAQRPGWGGGGCPGSPGSTAPIPAFPAFPRRELRRWVGWGPTLW